MNTFSDDNKEMLLKVQAAAKDLIELGVEDFFYTVADHAEEHISGPAATRWGNACMVIKAFTRVEL